MTGGVSVMKLAPEGVEKYIRTGQGTPVMQRLYPKGGGVGRENTCDSTKTMYVGDNCMHIVMLGGNGTKDTDGHFMLLVPNDERCPKM